MRDKALVVAIDSAGGNAVVAEAMGISSQAISQWKQAPAHRVLEIERLSGVSRHTLRPDIYGRAPRKGKAA